MSKTSVYCGGLPFKISEDEIWGLFEECGEIEEVKMLTFPDSGRFRGIAFITFKSEKGAAAGLPPNPKP